MSELHLIDNQSGDWRGAYVNGLLVDEGHSLRVEDVCRLMIEHHVTCIAETTLEGELDDRLSIVGRLPQRLEEWGIE